MRRAAHLHAVRGVDPAVAALREVLWRRQVGVDQAGPLAAGGRLGQAGAHRKAVRVEGAVDVACRRGGGWFGGTGTGTGRYKLELGIWLGSQTVRWLGRWAGGGWGLRVWAATPARPCSSQNSCLRTYLRGR